MQGFVLHLFAGFYNVDILQRQGVPPFAGSISNRKRQTFRLPAQGGMAAPEIRAAPVMKTKMAKGNSLGGKNKRASFFFHFSRVRRRVFEP